MEWLSENWFKLALVLVIPMTAVVLVYGFVIYPENLRKEERVMKDIAVSLQEAADDAKEQERVDDLNTCLEESDYQETTSHLALCGDPNVGESPLSCRVVFGGAQNVGDVIRAYNTEFPGELPELESIDDLDQNFSERLDIVNVFYDKCNCGLSKNRRDELTEEKKYRDNKCYALYSN